MKARSKLAVMAEATAEFSQLLPPESMAPYGDHFWPNEHLSPGSIQSRHMGQPMTAVRILPWAEQVISHASIAAAIGLILLSSRL